MATTRSAAGLHTLFVALLACTACGRTATRPLDLGPEPTAGTGAGATSGSAGRGGVAGSNGGGGTIAPPPPMGGQDKPPPPARCGNGQRESGEQCDGPPGLSCSDVRLGSGTVGCDPRTCEFDVSGCSDGHQCMFAPTRLPVACMSALCACDPNSVAQCDSECLEQLACANEVCGAQNFEPSCVLNACLRRDGPIRVPPLSLLRCLVDSSTLCGNTVVTPPSFCGDGQITGREQCDPKFPMGMLESCQSFGFPTGQLSCDPVDCVYDFSTCSANVCGNGVLEVAEGCDGFDLGGQSCRSLGLGRGELHCGAFCSLDTSGCRQCGNGRLEDGEECDGQSFGAQSCRSLGYTGGELLCDSDCNFDPSECGVCGDGELISGENCEGSNLRGESCESLGLGTGTLACSATSCHFDTHACMQTESCGNGIAEADEQCDGEDLTDHFCETLGFRRGGTLACNPSTCRFDTSGCNSGPDLACNNSCIDEVCGTVLKTCIETKGCAQMRACFDTCRDNPSSACLGRCVISAESIAVASVAADCVADCAEACR